MHTMVTCNRSRLESRPSCPGDPRGSRVTPRAVRNSVLWLVCFAISSIGCECNRSSIPTVEGEVRWQFFVDNAEVSDATAVITFPLTDMGSLREQVVWVQNVGRAPFTMNEFAKISGSPVTLGLFAEDDSAFEVVWAPEVTVNPSERTGITVRFTAPVSDAELTADYASIVELRPSGAASAQMVITGKALAPECFVPEVIDFGSIPINTYIDVNLSLRNIGMTAVTATVGMATGVPEKNFFVTGVDAQGQLVVEPNTSPEAMITFRPNQVIDFNGELAVRRSNACPVRTVKLIGRGVKSCLTWRASPSDDQAGSELNFGNVFPAGAGPGTVTFQNNCSLGVQVAQLHTSDGVFSTTATDSLVVPPAERNAIQMWVAGTGEVALEFRPTALGTRTGRLLGITSAAWQPDLSINLKGYGGGARIEATPRPLAFGRFGFTPGAAPAINVQRVVTITNIGTVPMPADPVQNLHLGPSGLNFSVRAISGATADELCVGDFDASTNTCLFTLISTGYDPVVGIEALTANPNAALHVPVRVTAITDGIKEWELTIYSNDTVTQALTVTVTAEAIAVPPCNYTLAPSTLDFGNIEQPQVRDLRFTLTNLGTEPGEVCYFNGLGLTPLSSDAFTLPGALSDFSLAAGQALAVTTRAEPLRTLPAPASANGEVRFNVSRPGASQSSVALTALIAPTCITFSPSPVRFSDTELECDSAFKTVTLSNNCASTVTLMSTELSNAGTAPVGSGSCSSGGGCAQFAIVNAPANGAIASGETRTLRVAFAPYVLGPQTGSVTMTLQQGTEAVPYFVNLSGTGIARTQSGCGLSALCPASMTVNANTTVTLAPTVTAAGPTTCAWAAGMRPSTSSGTFSNPSSCVSTTYFADVVGTHIANLTVRDATGATAQCSTQITVKPNGDLWVELTWSRPSDMDLHLLHQNAGDSASGSSWRPPWDCYWENKVVTTWSTNPRENPNLDRDDTSLTGPENTRIDSPAIGVKYTIGVHAFSMSPMPAVNSTIKLYCAGALVATRTRAMAAMRDLWVVGTVEFLASGASCIFTPIDGSTTAREPLVAERKARSR